MVQFELTLTVDLDMTKLGAYGKSIADLEDGLEASTDTADGSLSIHYNGEDWQTFGNAFSGTPSMEVRVITDELS